MIWSILGINYTAYSADLSAACIKNGVARPIAPGGPLDGLLSGKFVLAFLASAGVLVVRGFCLGLAVVSHFQLKCR